MGFDVNSATGEVTVDHSHDNYAVTTIKGNPVSIVVHNLNIISIFKRTRGKRSKGIVGDNSPMLYAFKGIDGLRINYGSISSLVPNFYAIIADIIATCNFTWDCIIPMPSGHNVANILADRVSKKSGSRVEPHALRKVTVSDVKNQIRVLKIKSKEKTQLNNYVNKFLLVHSLSDDFQMKSIKAPKLRTHINPVVFNRLISSVPPKHILLIDDMVTSGSTLTHAVDVITARYPFCTIYALTLLGTSK